MKINMKTSSEFELSRDKQERKKESTSGKKTFGEFPRR